MIDDVYSKVLEQTAAAWTEYLEKQFNQPAPLSAYDVLHMTLLSHMAMIDVAGPSPHAWANVADMAQMAADLAYDKMNEPAAGTPQTTTPDMQDQWNHFAQQANGKPGEFIPVHPRPGESLSEAINRTMGEYEEDRLKQQIVEKQSVEQKWKQ